MAVAHTFALLLLLTASSSIATGGQDITPTSEAVRDAQDLHKGSGGGGQAAAAGARRGLRQAMAAQDTGAVEPLNPAKAVQQIIDAGADGSSTPRDATGARCPQLSRGVLEARARRTGSGSIVMYAVVRPWGGLCWHVLADRAPLLQVWPKLACRTLHQTSTATVLHACPPRLPSGQRAAVGVCPQLAPLHQEGGHQLLRCGGG